MKSDAKSQQVEMIVNVENATELQELLQIANEQMKQLEITLNKINKFQPKARTLKT